MTNKRKKTTSEIGELIEQYHDYNIGYDSREIFLGHDNDIDNKLAIDFIKNLRLLESANDTEIKIHLISPGGHWHSAIAIYDSIKNSKLKITIIGYGEIASAATIILQAADVRLVMPNSLLLIHPISYSLDSDIITNMYHQNSAAADFDNMLEIYTSRLSGREKTNMKKKLKKIMTEKRDVFLPVKEALELNLIDGIVGQYGK